MQPASSISHVLGLVPRKLLSQPSSFVCPIGCEIMIDPVACRDGHSYERVHIERWLSLKCTSPLTGLELDSKVVVGNHALRAAIVRIISSATNVPHPHAHKPSDLTLVPCMFWPQDEWRLDRQSTFEPEPAVLIEKNQQESLSEWMSAKVDNLVGKKCSVVGLVNNAELNGLCGQITAFDAESGRFIVLLDNTQFLKLLEQNVKLDREEKEAQEAIMVAEWQHARRPPRLEATVPKLRDEGLQAEKRSYSLPADRKRQAVVVQLGLRRLDAEVEAEVKCAEGRRKELNVILGITVSVQACLIAAVLLCP